MKWRRIEIKGKLITTFYRTSVNLSFELSFMLKSKTLEDTPLFEQEIVSTHHNKIEVAIRQSIPVQGGNAFVTAAASIDVLFVNCALSGTSDQPQLPFKLNVEGKIIVFDAVDCSPVFEDKGNDVDSRTHNVSQSFGKANNSNKSAAADLECVVVEANASKAFEITLPHQVLTEVREKCNMCFGYTKQGVRCKNMREPVGKSLVWCHHHYNQEKEYQLYLVNNTRPLQCLWWEQYEYNELILCRR